MWHVMLVKEALAGYVLPEAGVGVTQMVSQTLVVIVSAAQEELTDWLIDWDWD